MYGEKRTYYHTCPYCGANLDPQESCDCQKVTEQSEDQSSNIMEEQSNDTLSNETKT